RTKAEKRTALAPFVTVGFPDVETSVALAKTVIDAGADALELGVPFSDPLADGPTIQKTSAVALEQGVSVQTCLDVVRRLRADGVQSPLVLMGYYNPFLKYGLERFVRDAADAGVDGFIIPDLSSEESGPFLKLCEARGMHLIPLLAPTSTDERIEKACKAAKGFIYCVSVTGVTGARTQLSSGVKDLVSRVKRYTKLPVLVGFGVSRPEHVKAIGEYADGAVVASALLDAVGKAPKGQATAVAREFVAALRTSRG
ncbi:MAG: tryptophan synthase subunit alpha, partial [SAR202 cluster bacterium]|nr:tryptophan synthase subunit alpha [SAR202 cluster bacterium]